MHSFLANSLKGNAVRRVNTGPNTRDTVRKAYEFALRHVGQDKDSGELWSEYIQYVKSGEVSQVHDVS